MFLAVDNQLDGVLLHDLGGWRQVDQHELGGEESCAGCAVIGCSEEGGFDQDHDLLFFRILRHDRLAGFAELLQLDFQRPDVANEIKPASLNEYPAKIESVEEALTLS